MKRLKLNPSMTMEDFMIYGTQMFCEIASAIEELQMEIARLKAQAPIGGSHVEDRTIERAPDC